MPKKRGKVLRRAAAAAAGSEILELPGAQRHVGLNVQSLMPPAPEGEMSYGRSALRISEHPILQSENGAWVTALGGILDLDELAHWQTWAETRRDLFEHASQRAGAGFAHRDCFRLEFQDPELAELIWQRVRPFVPATLPPVDEGSCRRAVACAPNIRVYRYEEGQSFGAHVDCSTPGPTAGQVTEVTVLIYLNGGQQQTGKALRGGETTFYFDHDASNVAFRMTPRAGYALLHSHGERCLTHEGSCVEGGFKLLLRTDVLYEAAL